MEIQYRHEQAGDYVGIKKVHDSAFKRTNESTLIDKLRLRTQFMTELSIVAEYKGEVIGHVLFYPVRICCGAIKYATLSLSPIAVLPRFQNKGVGTELIKQGFILAEKNDFTSIIVLGEPYYYERFGFVPASSKQITAPFEVKDANYMVREITETGGLVGIKGTVEYPQEFDTL